MSKAIRIREHLYEEIERLAKQERRSLIGQLEYLLEQALRLQNSGAGEREKVSSDESSVREGQTGVAPRSATAPDSHFKPDFGSKLK